MQQIERSIHPLVLLFLLLILGCQGEKKEEGTLQDRLARKKEKLKTLRKDIDTLERRLARSDSGKAGKGQRVLVRTRKMEPAPFEHSFTVNGAVKADQEVLLSAERRGRIEKILVDEGDRVEKGEVIAQQDRSVLKNRLDEVETRYQHAKTLFEKQKRLWKEKGIGSELEYLNAKNKMETLKQQKSTLQEELEMTLIQAPISGTIEELRLKEGAFAAPSKPIAHIVGIEKLFVEADLSERYLPKVAEGDSVDIRFPILDIEMRRPIQSLGNRIAPQDRTFEVRVRIRNTEERAIKPNLSAELRITDFESDSALVIPSRIVRTDPKGDHVYVVASGDTARKRYIELGPSQGGRSMVRKGLEVGDRVVVAGQGELSDGVPVRQEKEEDRQSKSER